MQSPEVIAIDTLERYTNSSYDEFGKYIILTNFSHYVKAFAERFNAELKGFNWSVSHAKDESISILNFSIGSPMAGMVVDVLSYIHPEAILMLGLCGGIDDYLEIGDYVVPSASIRDEGTSNHYLPTNVPALPSSMMNKLIIDELIEEELPYMCGIMKTTDYRMWEFNQKFITDLKEQKVIAIDMEIATLFTVAYSRKIPLGALMLVSDMPLKKGGIKTKESSKEIFAKYTSKHLEVGIKVIQKAKNKGLKPQNCKSGIYFE